MTSILASMNGKKGKGERDGKCTRERREEVRERGERWKFYHLEKGGRKKKREMERKRRERERERERESVMGM